MAESIHIDVKDDDIGSDKTRAAADCFNRKVTRLERLFLISNLILELPSAAFDQLSSVHKPQYALFSMLMSFTILIISIIDLVYKIQTEGVIWMTKGWIPWFYYRHPDLKRFGNFPDIVGFIFAIFQCIFASLSYVFVTRQINNPIKISYWPMIFAFAILYSRFSGNQKSKKTTKIRRLTRVTEFSFAELAAATDNFSLQNKLGAGPFSIVYRGKLVDGSEVVVKRGEKGHERNISEEQDKAFDSEFEFLSRLHHKHLVGLIGFSEDENEKLLVYEYMVNGDLHTHLHDKKFNEMNNNMISSWKTRIKIALDAARGIDYLHNYAVPPVIHRGIKSSNILLDSNWTARIADFAFSAPESKNGYKSMNAIEAVGYIDPEYSTRKVLTPKSDVYSFGVVLLELLTGKKAIFTDDAYDSGGISRSVVDFAVPQILSGDVVNVLDPRVIRPKLKDAEAVEMVAYTAANCANLDAKERPNISEVVANLERSLALGFANSNDGLELPTRGRAKTELDHSKDKIS
ncbi:putative serine/threonine-protein kinase-like protein CCR3 [Mercurialis annua]|uniref:putative serine/threonine-protein kinase-like protein CCR3 n=1 Tax=Mercurialis annua TaxID=3986 RepID=UPI00215F436E|nr:putative serine/threonine-protein kinase-like protein CCR3 [Mercurialis annua]